ncbi:uncharacterized protein LOC133333264 [Musca vetustissima]|uniref:uncharacterized protein LOC133333264 n=1 Tax=Musca vetustissima TaxID=27455 RepID=UPI002AB6B4D0|nr:uncharacterized protein LOC133333264 [Musca vetustissima]
MEYPRKIKLPDEAMQIQRVDIYLQDLKERLKQLRLQHSTVIRKSEDIIQEIDEVSSTLHLVENSATNLCADRMTRIKKLILEFEKAKDKEYDHTTASQSPPPPVDIKKILENFEKLNDSHLLRDSLQLFRKAKESLDQIDNILSTPAKDVKNAGSNYGGVGAIRHKIKMFNVSEKAPTSGVQFHNQDPLDVRETISNYVSCCSSLDSISNDLPENSSIFQNSLNGYEGDNDDSEIDVLMTENGK